MALSYARYEGTGSQTIFPVAFEYISKEHIYVNVDRKLVSYSVDELNNQVILDAAPEFGAEVFVYRRTPRNRTYSDFKRGNPFGQRNVNNSFLWQLYISQEIAEGTWSDEFAFNGNLDMNGYRIVNLGTPIDKHDAVTKEITDGIADRVQAIEDVDFADSQFITWRFTSKGGETLLHPPFNFTDARVYLEGVKQRKGVAGSADTEWGYIILPNNVIQLAEELDAGQWVDVEIGHEPLELSNPYIDELSDLYHYVNTMYLFSDVPPTCNGTCSQPDAPEGVVCHSDCSTW